MYTVKRASEIVGVSASTLRAWERRYGVGATTRSDAGYRLYDEETVRRFVLMKGLMVDGRSASAAAEEVQRRDSAGHLEAVDLPVDRSELAGAAERLDPDEADRVLRLQFAARRFEDVIDEWLMPALDELGRAWKSGAVSVAGEHMAAEAVRRVLATEYEAPRPKAADAAVVIGLPPGARHDLGLLSFAACARRAGLATTYLGADVPVESWLTAAATNCAAAVLAVSRRQDLQSFLGVHDALRAQHKRLPIAVGGALQERAPADCLQLGHKIGPAVGVLAGEAGLGSGS